MIGYAVNYSVIASVIARLRDLGYDVATLDRMTGEFAELLANEPGYPNVQAFADAAGAGIALAPARRRPVPAITSRCVNRDCHGCRTRDAWRDSPDMTTAVNRAGQSYDVPPTI